MEAQMNRRKKLLTNPVKLETKQLKVILISIEIVIKMPSNGHMQV